MNQKHHVRSSSQGRKVLPAHARPSKPPPSLKRGSSYNHAHSHNASNASGKLGPGGIKKVGTEVAVQQDEAGEEMASFLQFCATCERQIVTPCATILYCSQTCRKKDVSQPTPTWTTQSPPMTPSRPCYFEAHPADILPQRSPTILRPMSLDFSDMSICDSGFPTDESGYRFERRDSEAARYLAQFRTNTWQGEWHEARRPRPNRASTATESGGLPSLIHSPSSSVSTVASFTSPRPLPSRCNKSYSAYSGKAIDLVTPYAATGPSSPMHMMRDASLKSSASTVTAFRVAEAEGLSYDKRPASRRDSEAQGSLKQLFRHDAMKAPPTQASQISKIF